MESSILSPHRSAAIPAPTALAEFLAPYDAASRHDVLAGPRRRIAYTVIGSGSPVYIVPGICAPRRTYAPLAVELARQHRVVLHDLAGVTDDGCRWSEYQLDDYHLDLLALADHLGDRQFQVMGVSFGASIAVRAMAQFPDRIPLGMLVAGFARRPLSRGERLLFAILRHWPGRLRTMPLYRLVSLFNHARELEYRAPDLFPFLQSQTDQTTVRTMVVHVLAVSASDVTQVAPRLTQPILVAHGEEDRLVPARLGMELARMIPNVRMMLIPRCGHMPHLSHPELLAKAFEQLEHEPRTSPSCQRAGECSWIPSLSPLDPRPA